MYFLRLMISHIYEALRIINKMNADPELANTVGQCDQKTRELFKKVVAIVGADVNQKMGKVRNDITFHYIYNKIDTALAALARKFPDDPRPMSIGEHAIDWYFDPADRIIDNAVLREIFEVPEDAELSAEIGKIIERLQSIGDDLAMFAGQFIFHHAAKS